MREIAAAALMAAFLPSFALAGDALDSAGINALVSGNTVAGEMLDTGAYSEFYDADGTIRGEGYTGAWSVRDDAMCFRYGSDPENCWTVEVKDGTVTWVQDGKALGTGTVAEGNPNKY